MTDKTVNSMHQIHILHLMVLMMTSWRVPYME